MAPELVAKIGDLVEAGQRALAAAKAENVDVCYGSDLLGTMHGWQAHGLKLHMQEPAAVGAAEVLASLTATPARMLGMEADIGFVREGCVADLIVVDGDVLRRPDEVLSEAENVRVIVKHGRVFKNSLPAAGVSGEGGGGGGGDGRDPPDMKSEPSDARASAPKFEEEQQEKGRTGGGGGGGGRRGRVKREAEESRMSHASGRIKREHG